MCLNCGCGMPNDDMGDPKNLTLKDLAAAAVASNMNGKETLENMKNSLENEVKEEDLEKEIEKIKSSK